MSIAEQMHIAPLSGPLVSADFGGLSRDGVEPRLRRDGKFFRRGGRRTGSRA